MSKYPTDWLSKPLGKVYPKIVVGYVGNVNDHYCRAEEGVPFYRTLNIRDGYFRHSEHLYVTHEFNEKNKKSQITNNDILIARVGANLGMVCKANGISGLANMANAIIIKTNDVNSADADFYTSFLLSPMGKNQIYSGAAGGAQGVFNTKLTQEIIVPVPPLPEQRKIAKILSTWDKAITTTERLIASSQQQKKALMQQLLTGKKRLLNPETGMVFEGDWTKHALKNVVSITYGKSPKEIFDNNGQFDVIGTGGVTGRTNQTLCSDTSVVIGRKGTIDKPQLVTSPFWAIDTTFYCLPINNTIKIEWFYYLTTTLNLRAYNEASGVPSLSRETLYSIRVVVPSLKEQQKIASVLTAADKEIELLQAKLAHLKEEKKALMQQLLTGKRRVKVDTTEAA
ncbi:restriction endonuclease subunit S [Vibrio fluvialis]